MAQGLEGWKRCIMYYKKGHDAREERHNGVRAQRFKGGKNVLLCKP